MTIASTINAQDNAIIYIGDPMCSWCYGFGPEVIKVKAAFPDTDFNVVMGGLRPYGKETMGSLKDFLHEHWEEIGKKTGQEFGFDILDQADFIYDTEPASRAVVVMRKLKPEQSLAFFKDVQRLFYKDNKNPKDIGNYKELVKKYGVDFEEFKAQFLSAEIYDLTKADFRYAQQLGIRGFPSMVYKKGEEYFLLSNGYAKADQIINSIKKMQ